jgi:NAD(P)-dependent dehydrogenase (short-subunit alcohol dehydrogenase family)
MMDRQNTAVDRNGTLFDLGGRHAIVTGAGGGLGRAICAGLASHGADVTCLDLTDDIAARAVEVVSACGRQALGIACDVRNPAAIARACTRSLERFGRIDILVNLAGRGILKPTLDYTCDDWDTMVHTYLRSTFLFCQAAGRQMIRQGKGAIVNISSVSSLVALGRGTAAYAAVKAGVNGLTRELAVEWATTGVRVNAIAPCQIATPQLRAQLDDPQFDAASLMETWLKAIPMGRIGEPQELVGPSLFLASDASSLVTGHVLVVDGGYTAK